MSARRRASVAAICLLAGTSLQAGGNLQEGWVEPWGFNNSFWDERQQPIEWRLVPAPTFGLTEEWLVPRLQTAIDAWGREAYVDRPETVYGGVTTASGDFDNVNSIILGDLDVISGYSGGIATAPCAVLGLTQDVVDTGDGDANNGLGWMRLGTTPGSPRLLMPIGHYEQGAILECDLIFNVLEYTFTDDGTPGTEDFVGVATHEFGHWWGLSHTVIPDATMFPVATTNPPADGADGMASLEPDDLASLAHVYKRRGYDRKHGTIEGRVTIDGEPGDGVHVTAIAVNGLEPVVGRISLPWLFNTTDYFEGDAVARRGGGFYRIDGLPPGDYYVYAEWYDGTDERIGDRLRAPNVPVVVSNVAKGYWPYVGELDLLPERFEFYDADESADGGDGLTPGATPDNPDVATVVSVGLGQRVEGIDIAINLDPDTSKPPLVRSDPTAIARHDLTPITSLAAGAVITWADEGDGDDDYWVLRFPADELPEPPYNVLEGIWTKWGRADKPYEGALLLGDPDDPAAIEPAIVFPARRLMTGSLKGRTGNPRSMDVRDRFNVTINRPRDLYFAIRQPETPPGILRFSQGSFVVLERAGQAGATGRTLVTRDGFESFETSGSYDVIYRVRTEKAPPVMVQAALPATLTPGARETITISGAGFKPGAEVALIVPGYGREVGRPVAVRSVEWIDASTLHVTVDVPADVAAGPLDVEVANPGAIVANRARLLAIAE